MLKSHKQSNRAVVQSAMLAGLLLICCTFQANPSDLTNPDWSSVVKINFKNPESGLPASCSGVLINSNTAITSASCVLAEETGKQSQTAQVCANRTASKPCLNAREIFTHSGYLSAQRVDSANNLAYLKLNGRFNLRTDKIKIYPEITPTDFQKLTQDQTKLKQTFWVGHNRQGLSSLPENNFRGVTAPLEFDFARQNLQFHGHQLKLGRHFSGAPVFIKVDGELKLLGLVSGLSPDRTVHYFPEVNPCDLDPIVVRYPKEIMRFHAEISPYAVSACGMQGFQTDKSYSALACKRMQRSISLDKSLERKNPVALRQMAYRLATGDSAKSEIIAIYENYNRAIAMQDTKARELLAEIFISGELIPKDIESAEKLLRDDTGNLISSYAHWLTARELLRGYNDDDFRSLNSDIDKRLFTHLETAAKSGYAEAQYFLGRMYQYGVNTKPNNRKAYQWLAQAAMQGYAKAQFQVGTMWIDGRGVRAYPEVGLYWIRQAAARGLAKANNFLALNKGQYKIDTALNEYELEYNDT